MYLNFKNRKGDGMIKIQTPKSDGMKVDRRDIRFVWRHIRPYRKEAAIGLVTSLPLAALGGALAYIGKTVTENVTAGFEVRTVMFWSTLALLAVMASSVLEIIGRLVLTTLQARITHDIRLELFDSIQENSISFHMRHSTGELANLIANDAQAASTSSTDFINIALYCPIRILFMLGVMFYFNPLMSLFTLVSAPLLTVAVTRISRKARAQEMRYLRHQGNMLTMMVESLTNVRQVKHFGLETYQRKNFDHEGEVLIQSRKMATLIKSLASPITELILGLLLLAMIAIAYYQVTHELTTTAAIAGCLVAALGIRKPISALSQSLVQLQRAFAAIHRITWTVATNSREMGGEKIDGPIQSIDLDQVSFSYDGGRDVLKEVSLSIIGGEHVAIVGHSGAGKTTLSDLINGFYPCSKGEIRINGIPMKKLDLAHWRDMIGIVSQEPFLFNLSIRDNVRLGNLAVGDEDINHALKAAGCSEMLERLPDGIETMVGERGAVLSGGERKRVALARMFVRKPALMILDEATSELDSQSEHHILETIKQWQPRPLVLNISHRPSILDFCDRVLEVAGGKIHEVAPKTNRKSGTHVNI